MTFLEAVRPAGLPDVSRWTGAYIVTLKDVARARELRMFWIAVLALPALMILLDAGARVLRRAGYLNRETSELFSLAQDLGHGELAGLVLFAAAAFLVFAAAKLLRDQRLALWGWLASFMIADELLTLHDRFRADLGNYLFPQQEHLVARDLAEILIYGLLCLIALAVILVIYRRAPARSLLLAATMFVPFAMLGLFAIVVDASASMLHLYGFIPDGLHAGLMIIEDGGELFATGMIFMAALVLYQLGRRGSMASGLRDMH